MKKQLFFLTACVTLSSMLFAQTWTQVSPGPMSTSTGLTIHNGALFSSTAFSAPHSSVDGTTWIQKMNGLTGAEMQGGGIGNCGSYVYYGSKSGIHRSSDNGNTWTAAGTGITVGSTNYGRFFYEFNGVYYCSMSAAVVNGGGLYRSTDGVNWTVVTLGGSPGESSYTMAEIAGNLYVCSNLSFYESTDNGVTWNSVSTNGAKVYNGLFEHLGRRLIHTTFGMEYSDDNGATWDTLTSAIKSSTYCGFLAGANDTLYAYTAASGIYFSVDTGNTWVDITGDLTSSDVTYMQGVQYFGGNLYVGTLLYVKSNGTGGTTAIDEASFHSTLKGFPNPFNDQFILSNEENIDLLIQVFDLTGKTVINKRTSFAKTVLNTSTLTNGLYFLKISDPASRKVILSDKLIKQ